MAGVVPELGVGGWHVRPWHVAPYHLPTPCPSLPCTAGPSSSRPIHSVQCLLGIRDLAVGQRCGMRRLIGRFIRAAGLVRAAGLARLAVPSRRPAGLCPVARRRGVVVDACQGFRCHRRQRLFVHHADFRGREHQQQLFERRHLARKGVGRRSGIGAPTAPAHHGPAARVRDARDQRRQGPAQPGRRVGCGWGQQPSRRAASAAGPCQDLVSLSGGGGPEVWRRR